MSTAVRTKSPIVPKTKPPAKLKAKSPLKPSRQKAAPKVEMESLVIRFGPLKEKITDEEFFKFCMRNRDLRIEMSKEGEMIIIMPTGGEGGNRSAKLTARIGAWAEADGGGEFFDSSTEFSLPNGAKRSPDFSWVRRERWESLSAKQREEFPPLCPDFAVELRSRTDRLPPLKKKMEEYIANGAQLGWLIDPLKKKVYIYRPNVKVEILDNPTSLSGEPLLKGLKLNLSGILN